MTGVGLGAKSGARNLETSHQLVCGKGDSDGSEGAIIQDQAETGGERFAIHEKFWTERKNRSTRAKSGNKFRNGLQRQPFPKQFFQNCLGGGPRNGLSAVSEHKAKFYGHCLPFGNFFRHFALACINHRFDGSSRSVARPVRLISLSGSLNERAFLCGESTVASVKASCKEGFCKTPGREFVCGE
jgi:hypothetical protein